MNRIVFPDSIPRALVYIIDMIKGFITLSVWVVVVVGVSGCLNFGKSDQQAAISGALADAAATAQESFDYQAAAGHFDRLYKREPDNIDALIGHARNLRYSGAVNLGLKAIRAGLRKHGETAGLLLELAKGQVAGSMYADARDSIAKARDKDPDNWETYAVSGILKDRSGNMNEAQADYRKALEISPGNGAVLNNLALSLAQQGKLAEAIMILEKLALGEKSTFQTRQNLALLYSINGEFSKAERLVKEDLPPDMASENLATYRTLRRRRP